MTARVVVRLLRLFYQRVSELQLTPSALLPVPGCDPGPISRLFPRLASGSAARVLTCKTGTLRYQDNGVAVLSGYFHSPSHGNVLFVVAATDAGQKLTQWRRTQQRWILEQLEQHGVAQIERCGPSLAFSDTWASVLCGTSREDG